MTIPVTVDHHTFGVPLDELVRAYAALCAVAQRTVVGLEAGDTPEERRVLQRLQRRRARDRIALDVGPYMDDWNGVAGIYGESRAQFMDSLETNYVESPMGASLLVEFMLGWAEFYASPESVDVHGLEDAQERAGAARAVILLSELADILRGPLKHMGGAYKDGDWRTCPSGMAAPDDPNDDGTLEMA